MRFVIQRVRNASVSVEGRRISEIGMGLLVFAGIGWEDTQETAAKMMEKLLKLRIFADENQKTNLSIGDVNGSLLLISQFTLYADCRKGNRPSFTDAGKPQEANRLYEYLLMLAKERLAAAEGGSFGADMQVALVNDGPFTIVLDSKEIIPDMG